MVVDDEEDNRKTIKMVLEKNGFNVVIANNGDDCLKKLKQMKVDLILMDIMMPGRPTREVVAEIKNTKIIYLTAVQISEAEQEILLRQKNVVDFINKPFDVKMLATKIKKLVA